MQLLFDFFPIVVFFVAYWTYGIYAATAAIMVAMVLQIGYQWLRHRKVSKMLLISGGLVVLFGGVTLFLRNPLFIQWKVTIVNWLFGAAFLGSQLVGEKTLTQRIMGHAIELDRRVWRQLNLIWVANFVVLGAANLYVMYNFDEATWVNFKSFGTIGLTLITVIGQAIWISVRAPNAAPPPSSSDAADAREPRDVRH